MSGAKEDEMYFVPAGCGGAGWGLEGIYHQDTCLFDVWRWDVPGASQLSRHIAGDAVEEHHVLPQADRSQAVGLRRRVVVDGSGLTDGWTLTNTGAEHRMVEMRLSANARFLDLFAMRQEEAAAAAAEEIRAADGPWVFRRTAADGVVHRATLSCGGGLPDDLRWAISLAPGESAEIAVDLRVSRSDAAREAFPVLPSYADWRAGFGLLADAHPAAAQAIDDLRALLLRTAEGPYPAAGIPIFVNYFGRDALITAMMLLDWQPGLLKTVLLFLAARQGAAIDAFREEEPGKILHEIRRGELSRTGRIPFGRYYGSVDSTPLFLMAAGAYFARHDDPEAAAALRPAMAAACDWLTRHLDGPAGLATFKASGSGLAVQSWKDSANSMVDENGRPARQPLAVAEVQGYAYAALLAAARLLPGRAADLTRRAERLRDAFHQRFWLPELATYAMALDADLRPLRVLSSDPGHLLWTGIVPAEIAGTLVATLLGDALWSGWGVRTLGADAAAYNPVSYHNGSVWPHDTGLFAMGLARYGFGAELRQVAQALLDLADASPGRHIPELISGHQRAGRAPPVPYTHANAPQAWAAAAVVRMAAYLHPAAANAARAA